MADLFARADCLPKSWLLAHRALLMKLFDGTGFLLNKTNAKVITCYLRGAQHLPFSPNPAPRKLFPTVTVQFSEVLTAPKVENSEHQAQVRKTRLTNWLRDQMVNQQFQTEMEFGPINVLEAMYPNRCRAALRTNHT